MKNVLERAAENKSDEKIRYFLAKQAESYDFKVRYAEIRAWEFYKHPEIDGNCYVAVGGLDSITLLLFLRSIGINVPAVSVSSLEDKSIREVHKQLGVISLKPLKSKVEVIREFGWPVLSKEIAGKISLLQNPSPKNATVRHAIITALSVDYCPALLLHRRTPYGKMRVEKGGEKMKRYYANLIGTWVDITDCGTVEDHQKPAAYFKENLTYTDERKVAKCFEYDYIHVQYDGKDYRIHPSQIQIVTT